MIRQAAGRFGGAQGARGEFMRDLWVLQDSFFYQYNATQAASASFGKSVEAASALSP